MHISQINISICMMSSTYFEPEGSSSGRRLYIELWYGIVRFTCIGISSLVGRILCFVLIYCDVGLG